MSKQTNTVAVVEDNPSMLRGLVRLLSASGFEPAGYDSAEAFLESHVLGTYACLVLDINLPGMSGIELRRHLTVIDSRLPVIFITAVDDEPSLIAANAAGCIACLRKPFPAHMLINAIRKAGTPANSAEL
jgi:FixJ family two-component response regulator